MGTLPRAPRARELQGSAYPALLRQSASRSGPATAGVHRPSAPVARERAERHLVAGAPLAPARSRRRWVPVVAALLTALVGMINLVSALTPGVRDRVREVTQ